MYSDTVNIIIALDVDVIFSRLRELEIFKLAIVKHCEPKCEYQEELDSLESRLKNVNNLAQNLRLMTHSRYKRGLLNVIGSVSKSLFGTLDNGDLTLINENIDKLFDNNDKLKTVIVNQTALIRKIENSDSLARVESLNQDIHAFEQQSQRDKTFTALILKTDGALQDLHFQLDELLNIIILGKQGIISPQILDQKQFMENYAKALGDKASNTAIPTKPEHFQFILDISELKVFTISNKIFFQVIVPLVSNVEWDIFQVYPIPTRRNNVFMAPLVEHQIYLTSGISFINTDIEYLDKFCENKAGIMLCRQTQPIHDRNSRKDCQTEIIDFSTQINHCQLVVYKIQDISFIPLRSNNYYIAIPEKPTEINTICGTTHNVKELTHTALIRSDTNCDLLYRDEHMCIGESKTNITYSIRVKEIALKTNDTFEHLLTKIEEAPKIMDNVQGYRTTVDELTDEINSLNFEHRTKSIQYLGLSTLQILGYIALGILGIYGLQKIGILNCISKCMPSKLCIHLFCRKTKNHSIIGSVNQPHLTPSAPINIYNNVETSEPSKEEESTIFIRPRSVRFHKSLLRRQ